MMANRGSVLQRRSANSAVAVVDRLGYPDSRTQQGGYMRAKFGELAASTTIVSYAMHRHKASECVAAGPVIMLTNYRRLQRRPPYLQVFRTVVSMSACARSARTVPAHRGSATIVTITSCATRGLAESLNHWTQHPGRCWTRLRVEPNTVRSKGNAPPACVCP